MKYDSGETIRVGDRIRATPPPGRERRGSWSKYAGKVGIVRTINRQDREIGVKLGDRVVWFTTGELVLLVPRFRVSVSAQEAPQIPVPVSDTRTFPDRLS